MDFSHSGYPEKTDEFSLAQRLISTSLGASPSCYLSSSIELLMLLLDIIEAICSLQLVVIAGHLCAGNERFSSCFSCLFTYGAGR